MRSIVMWLILHPFREYPQVGVKSQLTDEVFWYHCPSKGSLIIPGFTGALTCPDVEPFCAMESITHIKYVA